MPSEARQKKIMEKLNRAQKCSILGPQNLGSVGGPGPRAPPPGSAPVIRRTLRLEINRMQLTSAKEIKRLNPKFLFEVMPFDRTNAMFLGKLKGPTILSFNERNRCLIIVLSFPYLLETYQNSM